MLREEEKDEASGGSWKTYSRSMSWTECPPRKTISKPLWNSKARACLPPLQPLCIVRPSIEEWPKAGSDDIGVWATPSTPSAANPGSAAPFETSTSGVLLKEFDVRKNRHSLFDKECSKVLDHVYLGCNSVAKDREILHQNGITHVLNCVGHSCPEYFKNELVYKTLWLQDCPSEDITSVLYDVFDYFEEIQEQGGRVLVHCCRGISRSTSLVIAYLMWKQGMNFTDAFQKVKAARGVADPNVGFACQLMQCQKRVHALPPSPNSSLRIYRMAPHSPYDPLHLVPKMVCEPGKDALDPRGAFLVIVPSAIFIWVGRQCPQLMSESAMRAADQAIRYERAEGRAVTVKQKEETLEFWDAFSFRKSSADVYDAASAKEPRLAPGANVAPDSTPLAQRKVDKYDLDFETFHNALAGGVVPPLLSGSESETCVPTRESRWSTLRENLAGKDAVTPLKMNPAQIKMDAIPETHEESKEPDGTPDVSKPSRFQRGSPNSSASYLTCSSRWTNDDMKEPEFQISPLCRSPSFSLVESFSSFYLRKQRSSSSSSSVSPSASDYSSSFTFSPSSSYSSELSPASGSAYGQPSPYRLPPRDAADTSRNHSVIGNLGSPDANSAVNADSTSLADSTVSRPPP